VARQYHKIGHERVNKSPFSAAQKTSFGLIKLVVFSISRVALVYASSALSFVFYFSLADLHVQDHSSYAASP